MENVGARNAWRRDVRIDRRRLGYGGGSYDHTLAALPGAKAIGIAYAGQEMPEVPAGPQDFRLPLIATEDSVIICGDPA